MSSRRTTRVFSVLLALCLAGSMASLRRLEQVRMGATLEEVLYVPSVKVLRAMSLGYTGLMADIYWTRTVQYFGRKHKQRSERYDLLPKLLEITTELDPHLVVAYKYGSVFLAQPPREGAGLPDLAVEFVEKGIRENPEDWQLYYHLGFIHFIERKDYKASSQAFERGSHVPGAHPWMKVMAAAMAQYSGERDVARRLWEYIYESTDDKFIRENAAKRLRALNVDDAVIALEQVVELYRQRTGRLPTSWYELVQAGYLRGAPIDPLGHPLKLLPDGRIELERPDDIPFVTKGLPEGESPSLYATPGAGEKAAPKKK
jgi:tetratricopeptide (TPR) repeat protein